MRKECEDIEYEIEDQDEDKDEDEVTKKEQRYAKKYMIIRFFLYGLLVLIYFGFGLVFVCLNYKRNLEYYDILRTISFIIFLLYLFIIIFKFLFYHYFATNNLKYLLYLRSNIYFWFDGEYYNTVRTRRSIICDCTYDIRYSKKGFINEYNDSKYNVFKMTYSTYEFNSKNNILHCKFYVFFNFYGRERFDSYYDFLYNYEKPIKYGASFKLKNGDCIHMNFDIIETEVSSNKIRITNIKFLESSVISDTTYDNLMNYIDITNIVMRDVLEILYNEYYIATKFNLIPYKA